MSLVLYDFDLSAECYAVRLFAGLVGAPLRIERLDVYPGRENEDGPFLEINPLGTVPVLRDGQAVLTDWQAILVHLAMGFDPARLWLPPGRLAEVVEWFGLARQLGASAGLARLHDGMGVPADVEACRAQAHRLLRRIDAHLWFAERQGHAWLLHGESPTLADLAVFVHVILSEEGGVERMDYPAVRRWTDRVRRIAGFTVMSGVFAPTGEAA